MRRSALALVLNLMPPEKAEPTNNLQDQVWWSKESFFGESWGSSVPESDANSWAARWE